MEDLLRALKAFPSLYFVFLLLAGIVWAIRNALELRKLQLEIRQLQRDTRDRAQAPPTVWTPERQDREDLRASARITRRFKRTGLVSGVVVYVALALLGVAMSRLLFRARTQIGTAESAAASQLVDDARALIYESRDGLLVRPRLVTAIAKATVAQEVFDRTRSRTQWAMAQRVIGSAYAALDSPSVAINQQRAIAAFKSILLTLPAGDPSSTRVVALNNLADVYLHAEFGDSSGNLRAAVRYADEACKAADPTREPEAWIVSRITRMQVNLLLYKRGETSREKQLREDRDSVARVVGEGRGRWSHLLAQLDAEGRGVWGAADREPEKDSGSVPTRPRSAVDRPTRRLPQRIKPLIILHYSYSNKAVAEQIRTLLESDELTVGLVLGPPIAHMETYDGREKLDRPEPAGVVLFNEQSRLAPALAYQLIDLLQDQFPKLHVEAKPEARVLPDGVEVVYWVTSSK